MPWTTSDGKTYTGDAWPLPDDATSHPRSAGCFTKFMREWVREKMSGRAILENARAQLPEILTSLQTLAPLVRSAVQRAQDGRLRLAVEAPEINALRNEIRRTNRRRDKVTIASVVLLGGIVWMALGREPPWAGWGMVGIGIAWLIAALRAR
jgi:N-acyl-D-glutamate deacylase